MIADTEQRSEMEIARMNEEIEEDTALGDDVWAAIDEIYNSVRSNLGLCVLYVVPVACGCWLLTLTPNA